MRRLCLLSALLFLFLFLLTLYLSRDTMPARGAPSPAGTVGDGLTTLAPGAGDTAVPDAILAQPSATTQPPPPPPTETPLPTPTAPTIATPALPFHCRPRPRTRQ